MISVNVFVISVTNKVYSARVVGERQTEGSPSSEWLRPVDVHESCSILSSVCSFVTMAEAPEIDCGRRWGRGRSRVDTLFAPVIRARDTCTSPRHATSSFQDNYFWFNWIINYFVWSHLQERLQVNSYESRIEIQMKGLFVVNCLLYWIT